MNLQDQNYRKFSSSEEVHEEEEISDEVSAKNETAEIQSFEDFDLVAVRSSTSKP